MVFRRAYVLTDGKINDRDRRVEGGQPEDGRARIKVLFGEHDCAKSASDQSA
jgi:hypothetical protein